MNIVFASDGKNRKSEEDLERRNRNPEFGIANQNCRLFPLCRWRMHTATWFLHHQRVIVPCQMLKELGLVLSKTIERIIQDIAMTPIRIILLSLSVIFFSAIFSVANASNGDSGDKQKAVLVTGASTGIGRKITEVLAANGYFVYAGARKQKDLDELNSIENVQSIRIDVTIQEEIDAAVETVRAGGRGLHGLVNNAGVIIVGPSIEVDIEQVQWLFDVNVFGVYRVTQAFAPLIIENKGRVTTIGSIAGSIGIEFLGPYSMSKHAIEAYTDALAGEMKRFGVHVSVIEPGNYSTKIWDSDIKRATDSGLVKENSPYADDIAKWIVSVGAIESEEPDDVAEAALHALFSNNPKRRYLVLPNEGEAAWIIGSAVQRLAQLNSNHDHSYSQEDLIEMLIGAMAAEERAGE